MDDYTIRKITNRYDFRGKRKSDSRWIGGGYYDCGYAYYIVTGTRYNPMIEEVYPETIGQYTGLRDKNGIKIYDGDILHFKTYQGGGFACPIGTDVYYRVLFGHCNPDMNILTEYVGFWALGKDYDEDDLYEYGNSISYLVDSHGACVVGNIHDNPELLKRV